MFKKAKENKKGFTLAELLIVVAIIAVLVAISIPIFTSQLEKSRDAVTVANLRAAYAEASSEFLTSTDNGGSAAKDITEKVTFKGTKNESGNDKAKAFSGLANELPFTLDASVMAADGTVGEKNVVFSFCTDGSVTAKIN